jgi:hypothetical protein
VKTSPVQRGFSVQISIFTSRSSDYLSDVASFRRQLTAGTARRIQDAGVPLACGNEAHGASSGCE